MSTLVAEQCAAEACTRQRFCKGLCRSHYGKQYHQEHLEQERARQRASYARARERRLAGFHRRRAEDPIGVARQVRNNYLKRTFGITLADFERIAQEQDGCGICGSREVKLNVDHCHDTGRVRGLLCDACNLGLGKFRDSPMLLSAALVWLGAT